MLQVFVYTALAFAGIAYLADWLFARCDASSEPPRVMPRIPLVGHGLGLLLNGGSYLTKLRIKESSEIVTLGGFHLKVYLVTSRRLVSVIQRKASTLSFEPFFQFIAKTWAKCSAYTCKLHADPDFLRELQKTMRDALAPGPDLDYQNLRTNNSFMDLLEKAFGTDSKSVEVELYDWLRHMVTVAAGDGIFGSRNPLQVADIEKAFWIWQKGMRQISAGFSCLVPASVAAGERTIDAFRTYHRGGLDDAARITKDRDIYLRQRGVPEDDLVRMHALLAISLLPNTVPTTFWVTYEVFSRPELVTRLRSEVAENAVSFNEAVSATELDLAALRTDCPLLLACLQEAQRYHTNVSNIRMVMEDTWVDKYLLKKGNYVWVPTGMSHRDEDLWGEETDIFDPDRFIRKGPPSAVPNTLFAWGFAPHLCPARQFASTEILVLMAMLLLWVDVEPAGKWERPHHRIDGMTTIQAPASDVHVTLRRREEWKGKWVLKIGDSAKSRVPLTSG